MYKQVIEPYSIELTTRNNFIFIKPIGRGGFGKVWKIERKRDHKLFAAKEMSKARIIYKKSVHSVINELKILSQLRNNFIINIEHAFQDREQLYLVMDYLTGGDLRYHIYKRKFFNEVTTKFFAACIILGLEYIHKNGIIHRDIKPENIILQDNGYLKITDFGIARIWNPNNHAETSGTPGYMAPEVICKKNHGIGVDYYALGIICYECMMSRRPYSGKTRKEIRDQILSKKAYIKKEEIPKGWSLDAADFINKLLVRKPEERLGYVHPSEVRNHNWFKDFNWNELLNGTLVAPFIPGVIIDNLSLNFVNEKWKDFEEVNKYTKELDSLIVQSRFQGYYYDPTLNTNIPIRNLNRLEKWRLNSSRLMMATNITNPSLYNERLSNKRESK